MAQDTVSMKEWIGETRTAIDDVTVPSIHHLSTLLARDVADSNARPTPPQAAPVPADHIKSVKPWVTNDKGGPALTADAELA